MGIDAKTVMKLREETGLPMMQCKKALTEVGGDIEKAKDHLRKQGAKTAEKKAHRDTGDGAFGTYVHHSGKVAVLVELKCETDFVAKNDGFQELIHNLALQICATDPVAVNREDVPAEVVDKEREIILGQLDQDEKMKGKPAQMLEKIAEGKLGKFFKERVLIDQPYVKDPSITVRELVNQSIDKLRENITIGRFVRMEIGE